MNYARDDAVYDFSESELEAMIKFEVLNEDPAIGTRSFPSIEDKYGRIVAYQVSQAWPLQDGADDVTTIA